MKKPDEVFVASEKLSKLFNKLESVNKWLAQAKEEEAELRRLIQRELQDADVIADGIEGTQSAGIMYNGSMYKVSVEQKINRTVDQKKVGPAMEKLSAHTVSTLFKSKIELVVSGYRKLTPEEHAIVSSVIKTSAGLPVVKLVPVED